MNHPKLYRFWCEHDLDTYTPELYKNLKFGNREATWMFIEENYLKKYSEFVRIQFDWGSTGIWRIPFPGSVTSGPNCEPSFIRLSQSSENKLKEWHDYIDWTAKPEESDRFDWAHAHEWGLKVALEICKDVPMNFYFEFNPFKEIVFDEIRGPVELEYPSKLVEIIGQGVHVWQGG